MFDNLPEVFRNEFLSKLEFQIGDYIEYKYHYPDGSFIKGHMKVEKITVTVTNKSFYDLWVLGTYINTNGIPKIDNTGNYSKSLNIDDCERFRCTDVTIRKISDEEGVSPYCENIGLIDFKISSGYLTKSGKLERKAIICHNMVTIADCLKKKDYDAVAKFLLFDCCYSYSENRRYKILETDEDKVKIEFNGYETLTLKLK